MATLHLGHRVRDTSGGMSAADQSRDREGVVEFLLRPVRFRVGSTIPVRDPWPADSVTRLTIITKTTGLVCRKRISHS